MNKKNLLAGVLQEGKNTNDEKKLFRRTNKQQKNIKLITID